MRAEGDFRVCRAARKTLAGRGVFVDTDANTADERELTGRVHVAVDEGIQNDQEEDSDSGDDLRDDVGGFGCWLLVVGMILNVGVQVFSFRWGLMLG